MQLIEHLIKTSQSRKWNLLENEAFLQVRHLIILVQILTFIYLHILKDVSGLHDAVTVLYSINPRNTSYVSSIL